VTPRERVLRALHITSGMPDRVPIQFDLCQQLLEHFGSKLHIPVHYTHNFWEDVTFRISGNEIRTALGADVVVTGAGTPAGYEIRKDERGYWMSEYGILMKQGDIYVEPVEFPLAHAESVADVQDYGLPNPHARGRYDDAERLVNQYHDEYFVIGDIELTVLSLAEMLLGMEKMLLDMAMEAEYLQPLFAKCTDFQIEVSRRLIAAGVDAIWVGDDFGTQNGLLLSPEMFRKQLAPHYVRLLEACKEAKPDVVLICHTDGAVRPLLEEIHQLGFTVFNPVQPGVPGHSPADLKAEFGDKFAFWGAIDQQDLLPKGSDAELEADIAEKIRILGKGGGYMIAPAHIIQADVSPQRVEKFIELCLKHGRYD